MIILYQQINKTNQFSIKRYNRQKMSEIIQKKHNLLFETFSSYRNNSNKNPQPSIIPDIKEHDYNVRPLINQTQSQLCANINSMEKGSYGTLLTSSCINAVAISILALCKAGDNIIIADNIYKQTKNTVFGIAEQMNISISVLNPLIPDHIEKIINKKTKLIVFENPGSYSSEIMNTKYITNIAHSYNALSLCDNSHATPINHNPIKHGVDIVVGSIGKYINGKRDITMGYISSSNIDIYKKIYKTIVNMGIAINPKDCYEVISNLQTLKIRMDYFDSKIKEILKEIHNHPKIKYILHPLLDSYQKELWGDYFSGYSSIFTFVLNKHYNIEQLDEMAKAMPMFSVGSTWGGDKNLIININPSEIRIFPDERTMEGSLVRVYCSINNTEDLIHDIKNGLNKLG